MKTKKLLTIFALIFIALLVLITCKKDNFDEAIGICPLTVTLSSNPVIGGITIGNGTFPKNSLVTVTATPNADYTFVNWTNGATVASTSSSYTFALIKNTTLVANFTPVVVVKYTVALSANPVAGGTTTGSGSFLAGSSVIIGATPNTDYAFVNWTKGTTIVSTTPSYTFTLTADTAFVANFTPVVAGNFTVVLSSNPVLGGTTIGSGSFAPNSPVTVAATPNAGYTFTNWTNGAVIVSTSSSYTFTLTQNTTLVANFTPVVIGNFAVVLSSNPIAGGTTTGGGSFAPNSSITIDATPNADYTFTNWTKGTTIVSTNSSYTFTLTKDTAFVANFTLIPVITYTLNVTANNGTVAENPNQSTYNSGSSIILTPTPAVGYAFTSWTGDATGNANPLTVLMNANKNITANFTLIPVTYTLTVNATNGSVGKNPNQTTYNSGSSVILTPTPSVGYVFSSWTGDATGNTNPLTVLMNANKNITANFILIPITYTLTVNATNGSITKNPNNLTYNLNDVVQLTAVPNSGYQFDSWSGDLSGNTNPMNITMNSNKNVTANFTANNTGNCPTIINLGLAGNFAIFAESGISTTGVTSITGDIGVNPIKSSAITGFGLILPAGGAFSTSSLVTGKVYAPDYAVPTPANMVITTSDMQTAYTTANGLVVPAPKNEFMAGNLNGQTLTKGIYKWSSGVSITNGIVLDGGGDNCATFIFQIAQDLTVASSAVITLQNGAQAKNIFWVVAGSGAILGTKVDFSGNILSKTLISVNTGGKVTGRLLAQTAVTLNAATIVKP